MVNQVSSLLPVDPNLYVNPVQNTQLITTPPKPLSKEEKVEAISKVYQQLIDLEKMREENPMKVKVEQKWTHTHQINGDVINTITKTYHYTSNFTEEEYQEKQGQLLSELEQLNATEFMTSIEDDLETLKQISTLVLKWGGFVGKNATAHMTVREEMDQLQLKDNKQDFKFK